MNMDVGMELYYTTRQVAVWLGVDANLIRRLCREGKITAIRDIRGRWLIPESEVKRLEVSLGYERKQTCTDLY
jgi:excisionase family DNA binding protein